MIKLRIDGTNTVSGEIDSCEVVETTLDIDSTTEELFELFCRLLSGLSFSEKQLENTIVHLAKSYIDRMKDEEYEKNKMRVPQKYSNKSKSIQFISDSDI